MHVYTSTRLHKIMHAYTSLSKEKLFLLLVFISIISILLYTYVHQVEKNERNISIEMIRSDKLTEKQRDVETSNPINKSESSKFQQRTPLIFCIVKTHPNNIKINKTQTIYNVWVHKCDNYRFISIIPEYFVSSTAKLDKAELEVNEPFHILQPKFLANENHDNLTPKMYNAIVSIYARFSDYDWYYIVDDDVYANLSNMRMFLSEKNASEPVTFGFDYKVISQMNIILRGKQSTKFQTFIYF